MRRMKGILGIGGVGSMLMWSVRNFDRLKTLKVPKLKTYRKTVSDSKNLEIQYLARDFSFEYGKILPQEMSSVMCAHEKETIS